jgi:hypothetical protein
MMPTTQAHLLETLAEIQRLSPGARFGQLLANLELLVEDQTEQSLWDVEDDRLMQVMASHHADLLRRSDADTSSVA